MKSSRGEGHITLHALCSMCSPLIPSLLLPLSCTPAFALHKDDGRDYVNINCNVLDDIAFEFFSLTFLCKTDSELPLQDKARGEQGEGAPALQR
jgi:hypothetical protein